MIGSDTAYRRITSRWRRPGMRRDLLAWLYDWVAGIAAMDRTPAPQLAAVGRMDFKV